MVDLKKLPAFIFSLQCLLNWFEFAALGCYAKHRPPLRQYWAAIESLKLQPRISDNLWIASHFRLDDEVAAFIAARWKRTCRDVFEHLNDRLP